jgi:hypothetical protein
MTDKSVKFIEKYKDKSIEKRALDHYEKAKQDVNLSKQYFIDEIMRKNLYNEYAKIHLKENLNYYKFSYRQHISSTRNKRISDELKHKFCRADKKYISRLLSLHGFLTNFQFIIFLLVISCIVCITSYYILNEIFSIMIGICLVMSFVLSRLYCWTSFIRLYFIGKLK